jgi:hypothetical protein
MNGEAYIKARSAEDASGCWPALSDVRTRRHASVPHEARCTMIAPDEMRDAFSWASPSRLPPLMSNAAYETWADEQRDRWAVEAFAGEMERRRRARGRRDFFTVIFFLLCVAAVGVALYVGAFHDRV